MLWYRVQSFIMIYFYKMKTLLSIAVFTVLYACNGASEKEPLNRFEKLSGLWQAHNSETYVYEEWSKPANGVMYGKGYVLNESDTIMNERIELKKIGDSVFYIPTVVGQNNNQPVRFKLISNSDSAFVFENPDHDFPQRITYRFIGKDSITARVQGIINGEPRSEELYYSRIK